MKNKILFLLFLFCNHTLFSQPIAGHAHNDYEHSRPFYEAFELGYESIEVDIWLKNNELYVAHEYKNIKSINTFEALYLLPMVTEMAKKENKARKLQLLIDVKAQHETLLPILIQKLEPFKKYLNKNLNKNGITIAISGDRPSPEKYSTFPKYIFFDGRIDEHFSKKINEKIALISCSQVKFGDFQKSDTTIEIGTEEKIKSFISKVKERGKKSRIWGTPDSEFAYKKLQSLGLDFIGADSLLKFSNWYKKLQNKN